MTWPKTWIEGQDILRELKNWDGAMVEVWEYDVSHKQFLVRLHRLENSDVGSLYLYFKNCKRLSFVPFWHEANIEIEERRGEFGPEFIAYDGDRLSVLSGAVFAAKFPGHHVRLRDQ